VIVIRAPAKIIIFGEHFIVSKGSQAIITTVGLHTTCSLNDNPNNNFHVIFKSATFNIEVEFTETEAKAIFSEAQELHVQYNKTKDIKELKTLIKKEGNFFKAVIGHLTNKYLIAPCVIEFQCDAPLGSGMGTSASIAGSMITAILKHNGIVFSKKDLFDITKTIEDLQHGSSSGADPAAIINGGLLNYEHKPDGNRSFQEVLNKDGWDKDLYLIHTGNPQESTGEMVAISNEFKRINPTRFEQLLNRSNQICRDFINSPDPDMFTLINENGLLLEEIGVVSEKVINFSEMIRENNGAIKIAGAGGRAGEGAGICLVIMKDKEKLIDICNQFNFILLNAPLMVAGIDN